MKSHLVDVNIIQAPTADKPDIEIKNFYNKIKELLKCTTTSEVNIIMGDFNAKVGQGEVEGVVGDWIHFPLPPHLPGNHINTMKKILSVFK